MFRLQLEMHYRFICLIIDFEMDYQDVSKGRRRIQPYTTRVSLIRLFCLIQICRGLKYNVLSLEESEKYLSRLLLVRFLLWFFARIVCLAYGPYEH